MTDSVLASPVTMLTGPGGVGKTELAMNVAGGLGRGFPGWVRVAWLGSLRSPELVGAEVAAALGLPRSGGLSYEDALTDWLADQDVLLLLDNCEHVVSVVDALKARLPCQSRSASTAG